MTVGLLLVTHDRLGASMVETATGLLGACPLHVATLEVRPDCEPDCLVAQAKSLVVGLDAGDGVLVLTDIYGSTPANIASALLTAGRVRVVAGLNLPMLVRVLNYARLALDELAEKAIAGGRTGVLSCERAEQ